MGYAAKEQYVQRWAEWNPNIHSHRLIRAGVENRLCQLATFCTSSTRSGDTAYTVSNSSYLARLAPIEQVVMSL